MSLESVKREQAEHRNGVARFETAKQQFDQIVAAFQTEAAAIDRLFTAELARDGVAYEKETPTGYWIRGSTRFGFGCGNQLRPDSSGFPLFYRSQGDDSGSPWDGSLCITIWLQVGGGGDSPANYAEYDSVWRSPANNTAVVDGLKAVAYGRRPKAPFRHRGACFVATALFGLNSAEVQVLREFRDRVLLGSGTGSAIVALYYKHGPALVVFVQRFRAARWVLRPSIRMFAELVRLLLRLS